jgi:hypothetical protein
MMASTHSADHEIEALQTDIMRFFAVVALCLMVIFSLVQSIPIQANDSENNQLLSESSQKEDLHQLEEKVEILKKENKKLQHELNIEHKNVQHQQSKLYEMELLLSSAQDHSEKADGRLQQVKRELQEERQDRTQVEKGLQRAKQHLKVAIDRQNQFRASKGDKRKSAVSEVKGHTLGFAKHALSNLVEQKLISFFLSVGNKELFQAHSLKRGKWEFKRVNKYPKQLYIMPQNDVPDSFVLGAHNTVMFDKKGVEFGVELPKQISDQIRELMGSTQGGYMQILSDGSVQIQ